MSTAIPSWANATLSLDLPRLRAAGEGQSLEYMREFPKQARDLGKEIAAFATSNNGLILIGIADDGANIGLADTETVTGRDGWTKRVEGICRDIVRPPIKPRIAFAVEDGRTVMVIDVPHGNRPVYYSNNVPYLRNLAESRPADPDEVIELVRAWLERAQPEQDQVGELISEIAGILIDVFVDGEEIEARMVNPWMDGMRSSFRYYADRLRHIASEERAIEHKISADLLDLAQVLEEAGTTRSYIGNGPDVRAKVMTAVERARSVKAKWVDTVQLNKKSVAEAKKLLIATSRQLTEFSGRALQMVNHGGRLDEVKSKASSFGETLLKLSYYPLDDISVGISSKLRTIGRRLHLIEIERTDYADGGQAINRIVDTIMQSADELSLVLRD